MRFPIMFAVAAIALAPDPMVAQTVKFLQIDKACDYLGVMTQKKVATFASSHQAEDIIQKIVDVSGVAKNFRISAAGVPNAAATVTAAGERIIMYNPAFISLLGEQTKTPWAAVSVMAHEVGHHLNGHTIVAGGNLSMELEADHFSGFVLQRMGATAQEATAAIQAMGSDTASATHPGKADRVAAIVAGWQKACEQDANCRQTIAAPAIRPPTVPTAAAPTPASTNAPIAASAAGGADGSGETVAEARGKANSSTSSAFAGSDQEDPASQAARESPRAGGSRASTIMDLLKP